MRRRHLQLALAFALIGALAFARSASAQDSFLERFIRAGTPAPNAAPKAKPRPTPGVRRRLGSGSGAPSIRYSSPRYTAPAYPARRIGRRSSGDKDVADEPIKTKTNPSTTILVLGDALADRLAQGIDQEFSDNPDIQIVRKTKPVSSLTRSDLYDWIEGARSALAGAQHYDVGVILIGMNDWQSIQSGGTTLEAGSDAWREAYAKRVNTLLDIFKEKNLPVVWVGLPVMNLPKFSEDLQSLNALVRDAVRAKGGTFVDLHDAFIGEDGKYTDTGPSLNGAVVKLRTSDGVSFTKAGALKAAYFVDIEVKRILDARPTPAPGAIATAPAGATPAVPGPPGATPTPSSPGKVGVEQLIDQMAGTPLTPDSVPLIARLTERPLIGPVFSLTTPERASDGQLLGASAGPRPAPTSLAGAQLSTPRPGRADDFTWRP
jgi:hypothetical protein